MRQRNAVIVALVIVAVLGVGRWTTYRRARSPTRESGEAAIPQPLHSSIKIRGGTLFGNDPEGRRLWEARFAEGDVSEEEGTAQLRDVECALYEAGAPVTRLRVPQLTVLRSANEHQLFMSGGVRGESKASGLQMRFDAATWRWEGKQWVAQGRIEVIRGNARLRGDSLTSDAAMRKVIVRGRARLDM